MIKFSGKVLFVQDETRELPIKDANGVPTGRTAPHRMTSIQMLCKDSNKQDRAILLKGFDLPANFTMPKTGEDFTTPFVRSYSNMTGLPEVSFDVR